MLDSHGRVVLGKELLSRVDLETNHKVNMFFDDTQKRLILLSCDDVRSTKMLYFVATHNIDEKGRIFIPAQVRKAFPKATYLPVEKDGNIYILIIDQ